MTHPIVFISYSHDNDLHRQRVLDLSERLRHDGYDTRLDCYVNGSPPEGWPLWMLKQFDDASHVLVVCTETYYRRFSGKVAHGVDRGVDWEGAVITQELYDSKIHNRRFILPVVFDAHDTAHIPEPLRSHTWYQPNHGNDYNSLRDVLDIDWTQLGPPDASAMPCTMSSPSLSKEKSEWASTIPELLNYSLISGAAAIFRWAGIFKWDNSSSQKKSDPILIAASIPKKAHKGSEFSCGLTVYSKENKSSALEKLNSLTKFNGQCIADISPTRSLPWKIGAPVSVRLSGRFITVTPEQVDFEWNGKEFLAPFSVYLDELAPILSINLTFTVILAGFIMAQLPITLEIIPTSETVGTTQTRSNLKAPQTAFASYASKDIDEVTARLSTLQHWAPRLEIFQDCLDLKPNKNYKPQLEKEIIARDSFMLFWSRAAAESEWVKWEYGVACQHKSIDSIVPMPLDDPAIVTPPVEFQTMQWRDRFMIARYAMKQINNLSNRA